ncbi:hypothetical protein [Amycolatopsis sp. PS_44_ISF1]|uniref:DUF7169 domain-containing protein n=1 Tax=Amycolatopsis sp. PS_44_ISF1 TaxID=2974917 RepID=UPI0028E07D96|nr:hypothetical protein [Amycolatopsis sp. PS_44_ISF1]MDT8915796.1 hypothetical protein [Amycolatopsis sp. PS_44_ISF1]MDT8916200.1 hypothetical protein [Amycolatopsis sp. PS_44_ISF1]MDT8916263.1 hypothetical protein [Amycolatopsis sp. PS_44_ISF1]
MVKESFKQLIDTMTRLGGVLSPAIDAQYEAPPGTRASKVPASNGVSNPTLDTVLDPRRLALSDEIRSTRLALLKARAILEPHIPALHSAVNRWEGQEGTQ